MLINSLSFVVLMIKEEDINQWKQNFSVQYFETFDVEKQLHIINRIKDTIIALRAIEDDFPPKHMEELFSFLESKRDEFQVIYNIKTNRTLNDFFK
jgi:hypothetical protein